MAEIQDIELAEVDIAVTSGFPIGSPVTVGGQIRPETIERSYRAMKLLEGLGGVIAPTYLMDFIPGEPATWQRLFELSVLAEQIAQWSGVPAPTRRFPHQTGPSISMHLSTLYGSEFPIGFSVGVIELGSTKARVKLWANVHKVAVVVGLVAGAGDAVKYAHELTTGFLPQLWTQIDGFLDSNNPIIRDHCEVRVKVLPPSPPSAEQLEALTLLLRGAEPHE